MSRHGLEKVQGGKVVLNKLLNRMARLKTVHICCRQAAAWWEAPCMMVLTIWTHGRSDAEKCQLET